MFNICKGDDFIHNLNCLFISIQLRHNAFKILVRSHACRKNLVLNKVIQLDDRMFPVF